eukprot:scaffold17363_cov102-Isochrysis_galbana.AAC.3
MKAAMAATMPSGFICALPSIVHTSASSTFSANSGRRAKLGAAVRGVRWRPGRSGRRGYGARLRCLAVELGLLEDDERLLVQFRPDGDVCNVGHVVVGQPIDVVHDARLVRLDGGENEQVLRAGEWRGRGGVRARKGMNASRFGGAGTRTRQGCARMAGQVAPAGCGYRRTSSSGGRSSRAVR